MATAEQHDKYGHMASIALVGMAIAWGIPRPELWPHAPKLLVIVPAYHLGIALLTPDVDLWSVAQSRWGPLSFYWWPYTKLFRHRGSTIDKWGPSHWPVIGTATRLAWLFGPLALAIASVETGAGYDGSPTLETIVNFVTDWEPWFWSIFWAIEASAIVHYALDIWASYSKIILALFRKPAKGTRNPRKRQRRSRR